MKKKNNKAKKTSDFKSEVGKLAKVVAMLPSVIKKGNKRNEK